MKNTSTRSWAQLIESILPELSENLEKKKSFRFIHFKKVLIEIVPENKGTMSLSEEVKTIHWEQSLTCEASYVSAHEPGQKMNVVEEAL